MLYSRCILDIVFFKKKEGTPMQSYLVLCESQSSAETSELCGYHVFASLARRFRDKGENDLFPHDDGAMRPITVSRLLRMPLRVDDLAGFYDGFAGPLRKGDVFAFRISFLKDDNAGQFLNLLGDESLSIDPGLEFRPVEVMCPGASPLCAAAVPSVLRASGGFACRLRFLSPTGFKRRGEQMPLPLPEIVYHGLLQKWRAWVSEFEWPGVEESFPSIRLEKFAIKSQPVRLKKDTVFRGAVGYCEYSFRHLKEEARAAVAALSMFSFFAGVGYKTAQGMGQVFPEKTA